MSKSLRLSEKWFRRGLWAVAVVFAWFLIGLGATVVGDLPQVEKVQTIEDFIDPAALQPVQNAIRDSEAKARELGDVLEQLQLQHSAAKADTDSEREKFTAWIATRQATAKPDQDQELITRTQHLDSLQALERSALGRLEEQRKLLLDAQQANQRAQFRLTELQQGVQDEFNHARQSQELRVFAYRLALTLPLLVFAGWLYKTKRQSTYWPFVWGFIYFALFAFFVELVPYLPSYGGYIRYLVGIVITALVGRQAILALNRYLEQQRLAEAQPETKRREVLEYDTALARLAKGICPGCERAVDLKDTSIDFCPHCGIGLHDRCGHCHTRKSTFAKYCHTCGTGASLTTADQRLSA
ncbi:MAG: serine endopeptidase [Limnobacter sp.]|uniref:serine endopeptidase n=1 Tax=Limnobacter sp. TaxID=2003368 RepID=UPI0022C0A505|nr:serine endopeptidase [Limnobacter sp.]MCZ8014073.1 serine endopeptidase [Limnobacter sp.]